MQVGSILTMQPALGAVRNPFKCMETAKHVQQRVVTPAAGALAAKYVVLPYLSTTDSLSNAIPAEHSEHTAVHASNHNTLQQHNHNLGTVNQTLP